ncbi:DUF3261 domain-containing protein [Ferrimonas sediminum]|nr:DUF3261 domain-containing protein [Ferrimonas sediminum]
MPVMRWLSLVLLLALSGCAMRLPGGECARLSPSVSYCLLPAATDIAPTRVVQRVQLAFDDPALPALALQGVDERLPGRRVLAATGGLGQISLVIQWSDNQLESEVHGLPGGLDPAWLLAMVQLSERPLAELASRLNGPAQLTSQCDGLHCRQLSSEGVPLVTITGPADQRRFEHHLYGVSMTLSTLIQESL